MYKSYKWELLRNNIIIKGILLMIEQILWLILDRTNLYMIYNVEDYSIKEKMMTQFEADKEFCQYKEHKIINEPSNYVVLNSSSKFLYKITDYPYGKVLIKVGKAYKGRMTDYYKRYWIDTYKAQKNLENKKDLELEALNNYNELWKNHK